nr:hypothetical protein [Angustibacter aerolatus]
MVNVEQHDARSRWPRFVAGLQSAGFVTAHALPMRLRRQVVGGLNLFAADDVPMTAEEPRGRAGAGRRRDDRPAAGAHAARADRADRAACRAPCRAGCSSSRRRVRSPPARGSRSTRPSSTCAATPAARVAG